MIGSSGVAARKNDACSAERLSLISSIFLLASALSAEDGPLASDVELPFVALAFDSDFCFVIAPRVSPSTPSNAPAVSTLASPPPRVSRLVVAFIVSSILPAVSLLSFEPASDFAASTTSAGSTEDDEASELTS